MNYEKKVAFLGGTCNNDTWRDELIKYVEEDVCFNPVVEDWTPECQEEEKWHRNNDDLAVYWITSKMMGVYSIAEVIDDSNKRPKSTIFGFDEKGFTEAQIKSLSAVGKLVQENGAHWERSLKWLAKRINTKVVEKMFRDSKVWDSVDNRGYHLVVKSGVENINKAGVVLKKSSNAIGGTIVEEYSYIYEGDYPDNSYPLQGIIVDRSFDAKYSIDAIESGIITSDSADKALREFEDWLAFDADEFFMDNNDYNNVGITYAKLVFENYMSNRK